MPKKSAVRRKQPGIRKNFAVELIREFQPGVGLRQNISLAVRSNK